MLGAGRSNCCKPIKGLPFPWVGKDEGEGAKASLPERRFMNTLKASLVLLISCYLLVPIFAGAESVTIQNGRMSADLKEASLVGVAKDIEKLSGIAFKGDESLLEEKVSVSFKDLPLEEGIKRILANMNYSLMFDKRGEVSVVMIMSEGSGSGASQPQIRPTPTRTGTQSPVERRPVVRRPTRSSSPLVTGGSRLPTVRPRTSTSRTSTSRPAQAASAAPQATEESNLPEAFRSVESSSPPGGPLSSEGPLPPAFRVIENAEPPGGKVKSSQQTPEAFKVQKNVPPPGGAVQSSGEKPGEEETSKEEVSSKEEKP